MKNDEDALMRMTVEDFAAKRALYPRVSDIIAKQNADELRSIPLDTLANACIRGQKVHDYCTAWIKSLWLTDVEPEYQPYVDAFAQWATANTEECYYSSVRLYDDVKRFTGEFDMIVKMKGTGKRALIDIKTSACKSKAWPLQLSAYAHLCKINGYEFDVVYNIHLKKTKAALFEEKQGEKVLISPPVVKSVEIEYDDLSPSWDIFSSALKCYDYFDRKEVK